MAVLATDIYAYLEDFGIDATVISEAWINARRDNFVIPWVERKTRMSLSELTQTTEYYSGNGKNLLVLNRRPIVSVDAISYVLGGLTNLLNLDNIEVISAEGILKAKRNYEEAYYLPIFAKGDYNIKVTYTYGFATIPDDMKEAVIYLCAEVTLGQIANRTGGGDVSTDGCSRSFGDRGRYTVMRNDLTRQAMALLSKYMTMVTGG